MTASIQRPIPRPIPRPITRTIRIDIHGNLSVAKCNGSSSNRDSLICPMPPQTSGDSIHGSSRTVYCVSHCAWFNIKDIDVTDIEPIQLGAFCKEHLIGELEEIGKITE